MELRIARHTERLDDLIAFYRDGLGLLVHGRFDDHDGYSGAFLEVPGTRAHLEFTAGGQHPPSVPHPETLTVLYLGSRAAVDTTVNRLGASPVASANPYWDRLEAVTVVDPDGFRVVLAPTSWEPLSS
jgi:catechol 2,3-dioxygenase-like lactoylglutathione lyase family enzyme